MVDFNDFLKITVKLEFVENLLFAQFIQEIIAEFKHDCEKERFIVFLKLLDFIMLRFKILKASLKR
jgi:hypothetical protein